MMGSRLTARYGLADQSMAVDAAFHTLYLGV
jgi:hypothetical protein